MGKDRVDHGIWNSRWTFILAATGSAVGLGNIWKFPYITGENGGGAFVLVYLVCIALIGVPIMIGEVLLGRKGRQSPIRTMHDLTRQAGLPKMWAGIGWMGAVAGLLILSFYAVIAGWALNYVLAMAQGAFVGIDAVNAEAHFNGLLANKGELIFWQSLFMLMTIGVVIGGVTRGLGNAVKVLMPVLLLLLIILLGYSMVEGEFVQGARFLFSFDVSKLSWNSVLVALGHAFFTLSLGMGAIMAYGAYMPQAASLSRTVFTVAILDTLVALMAGLAIFPVVFANGLEPSAGPGLLFVNLPVAFGNMVGGLWFGVVFFVLISIAAWSSAISLIEPGVAWLVERGRFSRVGANFFLGGIAWALGLATVLSFNDWAEFTPFFGMTAFDFLDFLTTNILLPLGGLFIAIFVGWFLPRSIVNAELHAESQGMIRLWLFLVRFVSPLLVSLIFVMLLWDKLVD